MTDWVASLVHAFQQHLEISGSSGSSGSRSGFPSILNDKHGTTSPGAVVPLVPPPPTDGALGTSGTTRVEELVPPSGSDKMLSKQRDEDVGTSGTSGTTGTTHFTPTWRGALTAPVRNNDSPSLVHAFQQHLEISGSSGSSGSRSDLPSIIKDKHGTTSPGAVVPLVPPPPTDGALGSSGTALSAPVRNGAPVGLTPQCDIASAAATPLVPPHEVHQLLVACSLHGSLDAEKARALVRGHLRNDPRLSPPQINLHSCWICGKPEGDRSFIAVLTGRPGSRYWMHSACHADHRRRIDQMVEVCVRAAGL